MPTTDQWEFACRAGARTSTPWGEGDAIDHLSKFAVISSNPHMGVNETLEIPKTRVPNRLGLFDMIGNVREFSQMTGDEKSTAGKSMAFIVGGNTNFSPALSSGYTEGISTNSPFAAVGIRLILVSNSENCPRKTTDEF